MKSFGLILMLALPTGCEDPKPAELKPASNPELPPVTYSSLGQYDDLEITFEGVSDGSLRDVIPKIKEALDSADTRLSILISSNYFDVTKKINLQQGNYTVKSLASKLCEQVGGSWEISEGKGVFLVFSHPDDSSGTNFGFNLDSPLIIEGD